VAFLANYRKLRNGKSKDSGSSSAFLTAISRKVIKRVSFGSADELKSSLERFIEYFNLTFAKPFNWTYTGTPTNTKLVEKPKTWRQLWRANENTKKLALVA
jgi:hypothetical protein